MHDVLLLLLLLWVTATAADATLLLLLRRVLGQVVEQFGQRKTFFFHLLRVQDGARPMLDYRASSGPEELKKKNRAAQETWPS